MTHSDPQLTYTELSFYLEERDIHVFQRKQMDLIKGKLFAKIIISFNKMRKICEKLGPCSFR